MTSPPNKPKRPRGRQAGTVLVPASERARNLSVTFYPAQIEKITRKGGSKYLRSLVDADPD